MPRNNSGSYTTPAGQPVTSGTTISAATHNALVGDLSTELTDSLSRSGKGGMSAPLRTPDGNAAAPSHSFTSETGTGVFRKGAANPAIAVTGSEKQEWTATGTNITGNAAVSGNETVGGTLGVTGNTTLGGTLGVTGAATVGGTLGVTGNATLAGDVAVQGATGLTVSTGNVLLTLAGQQTISKSGNAGLVVQTAGANTLVLGTNATARVTVGATGDVTAAGNLTVQGTTGVTLSAGDVVMSEAASQSVTKSNGNLILGTATAHSAAINTNGLNRWVVDSAGVTTAQNGATITGLPTPINASDAATKGYVDSTAGVSTATANALMRRDAAGRVAVATPSAAGDAATKGYVDGLTATTDGESSISMGAGWSLDADKSWLRKGPNGIVHLGLGGLIRGSGAGTTVCTLPAGYRPAVGAGNNITIVGVDASAAAVAIFRIYTTGVVESVSAITNTNQHYLNCTFPTT